MQHAEIVSQLYRRIDSPSSEVIHAITMQDILHGDCVDYF